MSGLPDCPQCDENSQVYEDGDRNFFCTYCKIAFDGNPDEGGDYSNDPTRRIELAEARKARKGGIIGITPEALRADRAKALARKRNGR